MLAALKPLACGLVAAALLCAPSSAGDPAATLPVQVVWVDQAIPGSTIGVVSSAPHRLIYGEDDWLSVANFTTHTLTLFSPFHVDVHEGQSIPGGYTLSDIGQSIDANTSYTVAEVGVSTLTDYFVGVTANQEILILERDVLSIPGFAPGTTFEGVDAGLDVSVDDTLLLGCQIDDPTVIANKETALLLYDIGPGGTLINGQCLLRTGDTLDGRIVRQVGGGADVTLERNAAGKLMHTVMFYETGTEGFGPSAIVLDGVLLAEDETPSIVSGRDWVVSTSHTMDLAANGSWAFTSAIEGGAGLQELSILVRDGAVVALESQPAPGIPGSELTQIGTPRFADDGTMLWYAAWEDEFGSDHGGLFIDDELVVEAGVTVIDGALLTSIVSGYPNYDIHPDGSRFIFRGSTVVFGGYGAFEVSLAPFENIAYGLQGSDNMPPYFAASGSLVAGEPAALSLSRALPGAAAYLVLGLSELGLPFKGGVLCPSPDLLFPALTVDALGTASVEAPFPAGAPSGASLIMQWWIVDPAGPKGFAASNCLEGVTP
jgi:hypothetical protein